MNDAAVIAALSLQVKRERVFLFPGNGPFSVLPLQSLGRFELKVGCRNEKRSQRCTQSAPASFQCK